MKSKLQFYIILLFIISNTVFSMENTIETKCVAHRGNNKYFLENSISSIKSAAEIESEGIEVDIRHTKDGHAILMHDSTLKRVAKNKLGKICPLEEKIKKLNIIDIRTNCLLKNNEEIPLLIEALEAVSLSNVEWFLELKDIPNQNTLKIINSFIPDYQGKRIISFKKKALQKIKKYIQDIEINPDIELFKLYRFYLFHHKEFHADVRFTPFNLRGLRRQNEKVKKAVWTVDGSKKLEEALKKNIDYITTNDPELCLFLKSRYIKMLRSDNNLSAI